MVSIHPNTNRTAGQSSSQDRITRGFQALLSLVLLLLSSSALADSFTASVDRKELTEQETFQLTLSYSPMVVLSSPDIDPVTADFDIVGGPRQMTSHHTINGKSERDRFNAKGSKTSRKKSKKKSKHEKDVESLKVPPAN